MNGDSDVLMRRPSIENLAPARRALWDAMQHHMGGLINDRDIVIRFEEFIRSVYRDESQTTAATKATIEHEQITPPPGRQGFADHRSINHINPDVQQALDNFVNAGGSVIDAVAGIEQLARRIAVDMLESDEFKLAVCDLIDRSRGKTQSVGETRLACEHQWEDDPTLMQGDQICRRCDALRCADGNVFHSSPGATVHTKPAIDHQDITQHPCDVPED